ncbi:putative glucose sorbosone dehydrogenase [Diplogelasinospora grovesii]|uniref:Glucose sorbosone dehydrogenase n=1 Tax=Diplogelasinospora grovesii TaxID=303347 RepID=A0AAN6NI50_9PEZI|nr:putative glucose sorbosone dehydrogenase [Diplogelasinospora grovesii]
MTGRKVGWDEKAPAPASALSCRDRMLKHIRQAAIAASLLFSGVSEAQCPNVLTPSYPAPVVGDGYAAQLIVSGLSKPRGIIFDSNGALLVVQAGTGILHLSLDDHGGTCLQSGKTVNLINNTDLNHGIELSSDGKTLYASSSNEVYSWAYNPDTVSVSSQRTLITNMSNSDHVTRTLLLSRKMPGLLVVSRGSGENMDYSALKASSGVSQIRVFNIANTTGKAYNFANEGELLGWGLRNSVGVAEHPVTGGIFSVENSADNIERMGTDIHEDDPGEEMNFHGYLNYSAGYRGGNYGYPNCFALWDTEIPQVGNMKVGSQFALNNTSTLNDTTCANDYIAPRLTFAAHMAPLDIKFDANGALAYVTFHGSWNRELPQGYKVSVIPFVEGQPAAPSNSTTAAVDILSNPDTRQCPGNCFRPVGLAFDSQGRIFMSSDSTGEIYVLRRTQSATTTTATASGSGTTVTSTSSSSSTPTNAGPRVTPSQVLQTLFVVFMVLFSYG